jgi:hypothetical protein
MRETENKFVNINYNFEFQLSSLQNELAQGERATVFVQVVCRPIRAFRITGCLDIFYRPAF